MSHLKTRETSKLFMGYLEHGVSRSLWSWWLRMSNLCQYSKDRVTLI